MASVVTIWNLALSHVGDAGQVTSADPPDGTVQAARCATYYPIARDSLLELRDWSFGIRRAVLADLGTPVGAWLYRYACPAGCLRVSKVLQSTADGHEPTEPFTVEADAAGTLTILTDTPEAYVMYVGSVTDTTKFSNLFTMCLSWLLASYVAGPLIKGKAGVTVADYCYKRFSNELAMAASGDASQHQGKSSYVPAGAAARA